MKTMLARDSRCHLLVGRELVVLEADLGEVAHEHVVGPHEHAVARAAREVALALDGAVIAAERLVQLHAHPRAGLEVRRAYERDLPAPRRLVLCPNFASALRKFG